jgi:hypothetical protein
MNGRMSSKVWRWSSASVLLLAAMTVSAAAEENAAPGLKDRSIGYTMVNKAVSVYQTADGKAECPHGLNDGPREQFDKLYPRDGTKRTLLETQLEREGEIWNPSTDPEKLPFYAVEGHIGTGLNLDGKVGPNDYTSPTGEKGIDNKMYHAVGCVASYRGPDGSYRHFMESYMQQFDFNRTLIELTDVDSLANDNDVTVSIYRGLDPLLLDAAGQHIPGGSQRADHRWGKQFIKHIKGKIVDGVLTTEPTDVFLPESLHRGVPKQFIHAWRVQLKMSPEGAEGLMGGYVDVERMYNLLGQNWATHFRSYGQESMPSEYRLFRKFADGYPDPKTGQNTAISTAWDVRFQQVFIMHPPTSVAATKTAKPDDIAR